MSFKEKIMGRKEQTGLLTEILIRDKLTDRKYYAKEVTIDANTNHAKRVDVMQFEPKGATYASDIEKGIFICYEIKSCIDDVFSGHGLNFYGEKNYIVVNAKTYKDLLPYIQNGKLKEYIKTNYPESSLNYGIMIALPVNTDIKDSGSILKEIENPTVFTGRAEDWKLYTIIPSFDDKRKRGNTELLFCMLRSKCNN